MCCDISGQFLVSSRFIDLCLRARAACAPDDLKSQLLYCTAAVTVTHAEARVTRTFRACTFQRALRNGWGVEIAIDQAAGSTPGRSVVR